MEGKNRSLVTLFKKKTHNFISLFPTSAPILSSYNRLFRLKLNTPSYTVAKYNYLITRVSICEI